MIKWLLWLKGTASRPGLLWKQNGSCEERGSHGSECTEITGSNCEQLCWISGSDQGSDPGLKLRESPTQFAQYDILQMSQGT